MSKTVGVCGYGYSGSGAVVDLLRSSNEIRYVDVGEFNISYIPDGLEDLRFHLFEGHSRYLSSDIAFLRFCDRMQRYAKFNKHFTQEDRFYIKRRTDQFVDDLTQVKWYGYWHHDYQDTLGKLVQYKYRFNNKFYTKIKSLNSGRPIYPEREMRLSINPGDFDHLSKEYVKDILNRTNYCNERINVIDQPFSADNPTKSFAFFDDPCAIIVDRDPRDVYILAKRTLKNHSLWIPTSNVKSFIDYYSCIRKNESELSKDILRVQFENLVYNYDFEISRISNFLGISKSEFTNAYFDPEISIDNTQLFLTIDSSLFEDINLIEKNLSEYLVDFSRFDRTPKRTNIVF